VNRFRYLRGDKKKEVTYSKFTIDDKNGLLVKNVSELIEAARYIRREFGCKEIYPADEMGDIYNLRYGWVFDGGSRVVQLLIKIKDLHADMELEERVGYFGSERGRMAYGAYLLSC
jgi:hypothetical protein